MLLEAVAIRHDPLQPGTVRGTHLDTDALAHAAACHDQIPMGIL
jgi:hypothetical protein